MSLKVLKWRIGIDPGWKNLGLAIVLDSDGVLTKLHTEVMNPSIYLSITKFIEALDDVINPLLHKVSSVTIERFVAYAGVSTSETENICMLIGALSHYFASEAGWSVEPLLVRAIDWKIPLVKALVKKKSFDNPSSKLDKKFSIAAGMACLDEEIKFVTDHEADSVCLAAFPVIVNKGT